VFAIGRATGESSLLRNTAYQPVFTWHRFLLTSRMFLGDLFFTPERFPPSLVVPLWVALAAIAWIGKSRTLRFAWLFLMLSALPLAFVEPRGAAQYYVPLFGWALYGAAAAAAVSHWLLLPLRGRAMLSGERMRAPVLLTAVSLLMYPFYKAQGHDNVTSVTVDGVVLQSLVAQTLSLYPLLPEGSRLLLLNESDSPAWDTFLAAVRLSYRDHAIKIDRARRMGHVIGDRRLALYDHVLDYREGKLVACKRPPDPRLKPLVLATASGPEIYHTDWSLVTMQSPARRGEVLIVKLAGLGATEPEVSVDQAFPGEPQAAVRYRVGAVITGLRAKTLNAFGWPGAVNTYRVDVRVPEPLQPGVATLRFSVREMMAPPVEFPVR
jgi:hypothetical protein